MNPSQHIRVANVGNFEMKPETRLRVSAALCRARRGVEEVKQRSAAREKVGQ